mgnify:CR=1 FL=1
MNVNVGRRVMAAILVASGFGTALGGTAAFAQPSEEVKPDRPAIVSGRPPRARPKRVISAKPRAISAARAFCPSPAPSTTPQAMARTFLTAPPISAPTTSSET